VTVTPAEPSAVYQTADPTALFQKSFLSLRSGRLWRTDPILLVQRTAVAVSHVAVGSLVVEGILGETAPTRTKFLRATFVVNTGKECAQPEPFVPNRLQHDE